MAIEQYRREPSEEKNRIPSANLCDPGRLHNALDIHAWLNGMNNRKLTTNMPKLTKAKVQENPGYLERDHERVALKLRVKSKYVTVSCVKSRGARQTTATIAEHLHLRGGRS